MPFSNPFRLLVFRDVNPIREKRKWNMKWTLTGNWADIQDEGLGRKGGPLPVMPFPLG